MVPGSFPHDPLHDTYRPLILAISSLAACRRPKWVLHNLSYSLEHGLYLKTLLQKPRIFVSLKTSARKTSDPEKSKNIELSVELRTPNTWLNRNAGVLLLPIFIVLKTNQIRAFNGTFESVTLAW